MQHAEKNISRLILHTSLLLVLLVGGGRLTSWICSVTATDIAYPAYVSTLLAYLAELLTAARMALSFAAMAAALSLPVRALTGTLVVSATAGLLDYAARFCIDFFTGALTGMESMAVVWLLVQLAYEWLFLLLGLLLLLFIQKKAARTERPGKTPVPLRGARAAVGLVLLSRLGLEVYALVDFLTTYSNITRTEIASITGQFLKVLVIYGGAALLCAEGFYALLTRRHTSQE